ncbi:MAG: VWA domain-containing protein [Acidobacteriota bacterium]
MTSPAPEPQPRPRIRDRRVLPRHLPTLLLLLLAPLFAQAKKEDAPQDPRLAAMSERHRGFLEQVELLITETEREVFLGITSGYQRDAFVRRFWQVRDPFPQTERNELQERWTERYKKVAELYSASDGSGGAGLTSEKARMMLHLGEPTQRVRVTCELLRSDAEVWIYAGGSDRVGGYFSLVFYGSNAGGGKFQRLWQQLDGWTPFLAGSVRLGSQSASRIGRLVAEECLRGDDLLQGMATSLDVDKVRRVIEVPQPSGEWAQTFMARSTEVPEGAERIEARVETSFPGRHQSRTVVQSLVLLDAAQLQLAELGDYRGYDLLVDGEVLRQGELFDQFRYRFDFPSTGAPGEFAGGELPLVMQRYLRPGAYSLVLKVEDTNGKRFFRQELDLEVPRVDAVRRAVAVRADGSVQEVSDAELAALSAAGAEAGTPARSLVRESLEEANASIMAGDHMIQIRALPDKLMVGKLRVEARTRGEGIERVLFELNDKPVMRKRRPPYSVELDLGPSPRIHSLRAVALDADGEALAIDEVPINAGPHRFDIRLIEPQRGKVYSRSVRAHAEVEVPEGEQLDRVELYLDDTKVATLYQPPFEQPMLLAQSSETSYVRALAFLKGGDVAEDVQFINAPDFVDEMRVQFVELYTSVVDRRGNFVEGMEPADFVVLEEGESQEIRRFERMTDLPIRAGLVIDTSMSMASSLYDVERAAYRFLEEVMTDRDRAALVTFSDEPRLEVRFTGDTSVLAGGLAGLDAEGETALFDAIIFTLHYFSGLKGKRAMVVLTDGEDSSSRYPFSDAIEFARRTGVAIYIIGLNLSGSSQEARQKLYRLARETGGGTFMIDSVRELGQVYDEIQEELRSQYLLAYQSSKPGDEGFREVEIEIPGRRGLDAKTIRGYYP